MKKLLLIILLFSAGIYVNAQNVRSGTDNKRTDAVRTERPTKGTATLSPSTQETDKLMKFYAELIIYPRSGAGESQVEIDFGTNAKETLKDARMLNAKIAKAKEAKYSVVDYLNLFASEGWEVVSTYSSGDQGKVFNYIILSKTGPGAERR